jgi:mannose-6-phosphate isomerase-like protein (cupin superfamily)
MKMKSALAVAAMLFAAAILTIGGYRYGLAGRQTVSLPGFSYWSVKDLDDHRASLRRGITDKVNVASVKLADYGESLTMIAHREGDGIPEVHATMDDYFVAEKGQATLVIGGEVVNPKTVEANEIRGDSIRNGEKKILSPGDIVHIPANMPHQLLIEKGKMFTYFVIKVKVR